MAQCLDSGKWCLPNLVRVRQLAKQVEVTLPLETSASSFGKLHADER